MVKNSLNYLKQGLALCFLVFWLGQTLIGQDTLSAPFDSLPTQNQSILKVNDSIAQLEDHSHAKIDYSSLKDTVSIQFLKISTQIVDNFNVFNIVKVRNHYNRPVSGKLSFFIPTTWSFIGEKEQTITIGPNDSLTVPIRLGVSQKVIGGGAYPVQANLKAENGDKFSSSFYIYKTEKSGFTFSMDKRVLIFNSVTRTGEVNITLNNTGNVEEYVRLEFTIGRLINVFGLKEENDFLYIPLKIGQDTTINLQLLHRDPKEVRKTLNDSPDDNTLKVMAISNGKKVAQSLMCRFIPYQFNNNLTTYQTPLSVGVYLNNLLANTPTSLRFDASGFLNLEKNRQFSYFATLLNVPLGTGQNIEIGSRQSPVIFSLNYRTKRLSLTAGNRIGIPRIPSTGLGALGNYQISKNNTVLAGFAYNRFTQSTSIGVRLRSRIRPLPPVSVYGGLFDSRAFDQQSQFYGFTVGLPIKVVSLSVGANWITSNWGPNSAYGIRSDNSLGYLANAGIYLKKFEGRAGFQLNPTVGVNSNLNRTYTANAKYEFNENNRLRFMFRGQDFGNGFTNDTLAPFSRSQVYNSNLYYSTRIGRSLPFSIGPELQLIDKSNNQLFTQEIRNIRSTAIRLGSFLTYKFSSTKSVTVFFRPGLSFSENTSTFWRIDSTNANRSEGLFNYNLGFSYNKGKNFRLNVSYFYGPYFYFFQSAEDQSGVISQSLRINPVYQRTFNYDSYKIRLVSTSSILLDISNNSERYSSTLQGSILTNSGWSFGTFANLYINSRENDERLRQSFRTYSLNLFARKSFYIQKKENNFYDLSVVSFNDINGNGTREENEPFIDNVLITVKRNKGGAVNSKYFRQKELLSNESGEIKYTKIASGSYILEVVPLREIGELFPINGYEQKIEVFANTTYFIPFVETYKVKGKMLMVRDPNSSLGHVELNNIRVTAKDVNGKEFYGLTNKYGEFTLNVPTQGSYRVSINNVYAENFIVENNEILVNFNGFKVFEIEFVFKEQERGINFSGGDGYDFKMLKGQPPAGNSNVAKEADAIEQNTKQPQNQPKTKGTETSQVQPSLNSEAEQKLWEKTEELQQQIDELKKIKQELQEMKDQGQSFPQPNTSPKNQNQENPDLINDLIKQTNPTTNYRVVFGVFKEKLPVDFLNQLIRFGSVETAQNDDGSSRFVSRPFNNLEAAQGYGDYLKEQGLNGVVVTGEINGKPASIEAVKKARQNP